MSKGAKTALVQNYQHLHGSTRFMGSCSMSSSPILPFEFTTGKTQVWNRRSVAPLGIEVLQAVARVDDPNAIVWRGDPNLRGRTKACGFWADHWDTLTLFVPNCLRCLRHMTSCQTVLTIQDLQCAWLLLLYCYGAQANCTLRVVHPELTAGFATHHDASSGDARGCSCQHVWAALGSAVQHCSQDPLCGQAGQTVWR